ncbi:MAG: hypothetical protein H6Q77_1300 [Gemmatimonadetes bacterium]|nr:hypothetical protein [Gemmatimonadota bacterium]
MGRALHRNGFSASRLERVMGRLAEKLGLPLPQIFSTPTAIYAAFGSLAGQSTHLLRVEPGSVSLGHLTQLDRVASDVLGGSVSPEAGLARLDEIEASPDPYGNTLTVIAFALTSGAVARFLGGGLREIGVGVAIGIVTGLLALLAARVKPLGDVFEPVAACAAALIAGVLSARWLPFATSTATLAGLIVLIPGFMLTIAIRELSTRHLASGTARLFAANITFLGIIFGVALGNRLALIVAGPARLAPVQPLPAWTFALSALLAGLAFTVILKAEWRDAPWVVLAGLLAVVAGRVGATALGLELGSFVGALVVGVAGNLFSRLRNRPSSVMLVPGVLMLVPGTIGFRSLSWLLDSQVVPAVETAFRMVLTAIALVAGLLFADIISPERRV